MNNEMTQREAVRRAWQAAEKAEYFAEVDPGAARTYACISEAWAALAAQLPFEQPEACLRPESHMPPASETLLLPRPLERREDPTNVRTPAELEHEAARAALRGEPVPDPRADETVVLEPVRSTAVPQPGSIDRTSGTAICMCGIGIHWDEVAWCHDNGGGVCPS